MDIDKLHVDEKTFRELHEQDRIAHEKLAEGIDGLSKTQASLKALLMEKMKGDSSNAARDLFSVFDLDGDGFITREEWGGSDAVFDALDVNGDGRITPEEMGAGLGAAFRLPEAH
jgi:transaldolase